MIVHFPFGLELIYFQNPGHYECHEWIPTHGVDFKYSPRSDWLAVSHFYASIYCGLDRFKLWLKEDIVVTVDIME